MCRPPKWQSNCRLHVPIQIGTTGRETAARSAIAPFSYRQNSFEAVGGRSGVRAPSAPLRRRRSSGPTPPPAAFRRVGGQACATGPKRRSQRTRERRLWHGRLALPRPWSSLRCDLLGVRDTELYGVIRVLFQKERPPRVDVFIQHPHRHFLLKGAAELRVDLDGDMVDSCHRELIVRSARQDFNSFPHRL
jgi:hypothetical protein